MEKEIFALMLMVVVTFTGFQFPEAAIAGYSNESESSLKIPARWCSIVRSNSVAQGADFYSIDSHFAAW